MKSGKKISAILLLMGLLVTPSAIMADEVEVLNNGLNAKNEVSTDQNYLKDGWVEEGGKIYFYENGSKYYGWLDNEDGKYYLDWSTGELKTGVFTDTYGNTYYSDESGLIQTGWVNFNGKTYYASDYGYGYDYGRLLRGTHRINEKLYYFNSDYSLRTTEGWVKSEIYGSEEYFYVNQDGTLYLGWKLENGKYYYLDKYSGYMHSNDVVEVDGYMYGFDSSGAMETGWKEHYGGWYYFGQDGAAAEGWKFINNEWYYFEEYGGRMYIGAYMIDDETYVFNESGHMVTSQWYQAKRPYDEYSLDEWYYLEESGKAKKGWVLENNAWYYFNEYEATMETGGVNIDDITYVFNEGGQMVTSSGWISITNKWGYQEWYYTNSNGTANIGWVLDGGSWYYFDEYEGSMMTGIIELGKDIYILGDDGKMITSSWYSTDIDRWYYADENGKAKKGWLQDGANWYYFSDKHGHMITGNANIKGELHSFGDNGVWLGKIS